VAGLVDIPPVRFGVLNFIGTVIYIVVLSSIGYSLGGEWSKLNHSLSLASYILVAVVVLAIIGFVLKFTIGLRPTAEQEEAGLDLSDHGEEGYIL